MSLDDIRMHSEDLIDKEQLDCGGFGTVSLCFHRNHGLVVLKTVYTGLKHEMYNEALLEEGKIMHRLNHDRVVKLLGLILENGNYSLVMEYMTKGNLCNVLQQVTVPLSVKGRFILEIIEGMTYLHDQNIVHKDLKPENVLVDNDFHIKIADLGVATFKTWSKLTKEETYRKQKSQSINGHQAKNNAGTLSYMAPEHLKSLSTKPTEKSDVYSFGIVIWAILTGKEPYENAFNIEQLRVCVIGGDRPSLEELPENSPPEALDMMQLCWKDKPEERPTFRECDEKLRTFYTNKLQKKIESDVAKMSIEFPKPQGFIERMASLQLDCDAEPPSIATKDQPQSLHSSQGLLTGDLDECLFSPGEPVESEYPKQDENLERKLQEEVRYHQTGSRFDDRLSMLDVQPSFAEIQSMRESSESYSKYPTNLSTHMSNVRPFISDSEKPVDHSMSFDQRNIMPNAESCGPDVTPGYHSQTAQQVNIPNSAFEGHNIYSGTPGPASHSFGFDTNLMPTLPFHTALYVPIPESGMSDPYQQPPKPVSEARYGGETSMSLHIVNSKSVQIGNNNVMNIQKPPPMKKSPIRTQCLIDPAILESNAVVNEKHLQLLRDNLSIKWKTFVRLLGFRDPEIEEIDHDFERDGLREKVYQALHKWIMKEGSKNATVGKVAYVLHSMSEIELLNEFINIEQN
ncbi:receptor-interacting serine/threonine-protein kinase 1 isoform X2 [Bombina bombina]|uniref:receptor-interacting serine/threonine-protein kinase 1 isoform X2 n=1 Tax=Bombina bombina TaxID=8345 RepID=UPI00235AFB3E|nr:receptor-interacting serine/threonine-protein kinase 1 isoform X2 [Bombina bombina]